MSQPQTFTSAVRGAQVIDTITMAQLYAIVREKLDYFHPERSDPDAFCQDMCCQIEKVMGIYPNVPSLSSPGTSASEPVDPQSGSSADRSR